MINLNFYVKSIVPDKDDGVDCQFGRENFCLSLPSATKLSLRDEKKEKSHVT